MNKTTINGIDVSECEHHYTNPVNGTIYHGCAIYEQINELGYSQDTLCEQNPNCYFKQLKRLEQENKELKEKIDIYENSIIANHDRAVGKRLMEVLLALEEIQQMLIYAEIAPRANQHFEYMDKALAKTNEVLNEQPT